MKHRTVVTGGAGFIGSHLVEKLVAQGDDVVVIDNLAVGHTENLAAVWNDPRMAFVQADVANLADIKPLFAGATRVFHLAALADIVPSIERPGDYYRANVDGTFNVCEAARAADVKRFVYAASSSCYGIPDLYPTPETARISPQYPYALTKNIGEQIVLHWSQVYRIPSVALRFFNVYGPRARTNGTYGAVFGVFLAQKMAGRPYTIVGDGTQTRDFTFVSDIVEGLVAAADSPVTGEAINLGSGGTYSINQLVGLLGGRAVHIPKRPGEPNCTFADVSKASAVLGWHPRVSFEAGVTAMMTRLDDWRDAPVWDPGSIATATHAWFAHLTPAGRF